MVRSRSSRASKPGRRLQAAVGRPVDTEVVEQVGKTNPIRFWGMSHEVER